MAVDGFASAGRGVEHAARSTSGSTTEHTMVMASTWVMMATTDDVMASTAMLVVMMMVVVRVSTMASIASNRTRTCGGRIGSPLAATPVGIGEQRILMRLRIGMQVVVDFGLQLSNGGSGCCGGIDR